MNYLKQLIVPALTALVVVLLVSWIGGSSSHRLGAASTLGTNNIPTTLTGGSGPSVFNALEATESFISDGVNYLLATSTEANGGVSVVNVPAYEVKGGVNYAYVNKSFSSTSSIPVIIANPFGAATTSIDAVTCRITTGILGANSYDLSTTSAATGYGSSTPALISSHSVASNGVDTIVWKPSLVASTSIAVANTVFTSDALKDGSDPFILRPSEFLTLRIATGTAGLALPVGSCSAQFSR